MEQELKKMCLPLGLATLLSKLCFKIIIKEMNSCLCMRTFIYHSILYTGGN